MTQPGKNSFIVKHFDFLVYQNMSLVLFHVNNSSNMPKV